MEEKIVRIAVILRDLKYSIPPSPAENQLIQKKLCLAKYLGLLMPYSFTWLPRGPFSNMLVPDLDAVAKQGYDGISRYRLKGSTKNIIFKVNNALNTAALVNLKNEPDKIYDVLACVAFVDGTHLNFSDKEVKWWIKKHRPELSPSRIVKTIKLYHLLKEV